VRRVVFASSSSVYGTGVPTPFREDAILGKPTSPYAETKQVGETMVREFADRSGGRAAIVRLFSVYGPRQRPDLALHRFTSLLREGRAVPIFGTADSRRDYTHVADVARGIGAALDWTAVGAAGCEAFNLGAGHPERLHSLVSGVARRLGVEAELVVYPAHPADLPVTWADTTKARAALGFAPRIRLPDGIADFVAWFEREHGRQPCPAA
jgi:UDP-glucuronate 4-epimerase